MAKINQQEENLPGGQDGQAQTASQNNGEGIPPASGDIPPQEGGQEPDAGGTDSAANGEQTKTVPGGGDNFGAAPQEPPKDSGGKNKGGRNSKSGDPESRFPIGAIRNKDGKEFVKVAPGDWRPVVRFDDTEDPEEEVMVKIINKTLKGQKVFLSKGTVEFNNEGVAEVSVKEAARLCGIPGYS